MRAKEFCTCEDLACPLNPANHEQGCDLCVAKCLQKKEIPSCFFNKLPGERSKDYSFEGFAKEVLGR